MRVHFLLEGSGLFGGVKVVLAQANLLRRRGHDVAVICREPAPEWYPLDADFVQADALGGAALPAADVVVATFWTTIAAALRSGRPVLHYCQGYEGVLGYPAPTVAEIERAYAEPVPAMVTSPHLGELLKERFDRPWRLAPPILEDYWQPSRWLPLRDRRPQILVVGDFEVPLKGVVTALQAVRALRSSGLDCALVRLSPTPCSEAERALMPADEFHVGVPPSRAAAIFRGADLLLAPSQAVEGFGLPVLEAMASGVPVIASDVPCFRGFAADAAKLVPADDPEAFAEAARRVLADDAVRRRQRDMGLEVAARLAADFGAENLESVLAWAAAGDRRAGRSAAT